MIIMTERPADLYRHIENGHLYAVLSPIRIKVDGKWHEGYHYVRIDPPGTKPFARTKADFHNRFYKAKDEL